MIFHPSLSEVVQKPLQSLFELRQQQLVMVVLEAEVQVSQDKVVEAEVAVQFD